MSLQDVNNAQIFSDELNKKGYPAEVLASTVGEQTYHRVVIKQFKAYGDTINAQRRLTDLKGVAGLGLSVMRFKSVLT